MPSSLRRFAGRRFWRQAARAQQTVACGGADWSGGTLAIAPIAGAELFLARAIGSGRNDAFNRCGLARSSSGARPQFARYRVGRGHRCGAADGKEPNHGALF